MSGYLGELIDRFNGNIVLAYYGRVGATIMGYLNSHIDQLRSLRRVVAEPGLRFAAIPRDIVGMVLERLTCPHDGVCDPFTVCTFQDQHGTLVSCKYGEHEIPTLLPGERFLMQRFAGGVLHSETQPATILAYYGKQQITWYRNGQFHNTHGYCVRITRSTGAYNYVIASPPGTPLADSRVVCSSYGEDRLSNGGLYVSHEDWEKLRNELRNRDPVPL